MFFATVTLTFRLGIDVNFLLQKRKKSRRENEITFVVTYCWDASRKPVKPFNVYTSAVRLNSDGWLEIHR